VIPKDRPSRLSEHDNCDPALCKALLITNVLVGCEQDLKAARFCRIEQLSVLECGPFLFCRRSNCVICKELAKRRGCTLIKQNEHYWSAADESRLRTAKSITALTCSRSRPSYQLTMSSRLAPASRFSNIVATGILVPRSTQAPLNLPGMRSTAGQRDQSNAVTLGVSYRRMASSSTSSGNRPVFCSKRLQPLLKFRTDVYVHHVQSTHLGVSLSIDVFGRFALERVTKPPRPDPPRGGSVKKYGRRAVSRSVMGSCRTVLANSIPSVTRRTAADLRSRVPHRHSLRPPQRHSLADAPARTRVRVGDDVLASPARLAVGGCVGSHPFRGTRLTRAIRLH
jgi:hypothetical protein